MRGGNLSRFHPHPRKSQKGGEWRKDIGKEAVKGAVLQVAKPALIQTGLLPRKSLKRGVKRKATTILSKKVKRKVIRDIFGK